MKKKLIAAAVVSAFAAPVAFAQTPSNVTIYGNLQAEFISIEADGATVGAPNNDYPRRNRIGSPGVFNIGFRGAESLGGGLSVIWQVEQNVGSADGTGGTNTWGSRNTFLGLQSSIGQVFFGNYDSPLKIVLGVNNFAFGLTGANGINAILNNGDATGLNPIAGGGDAAFSRRVNNSLNWASPVFSGFSVRAQYAANEQKSVTAGPGPEIDPYLYSVAAYYTGGPFRAGLGYQKHVGFRSLAANGRELDDMSWLASASFNSGPFLVTAAYSRLEYETASTDITRNNWLVSGQYSLAQHRFRVQYLEARDVSGSNTFNAANLGVSSNGGAGVTTLGNIVATGDNSGASHWSVGYGYALSKRSEGYLFYTRLKNDANGRTDFAGGHASGVVRQNGHDADAFGIGLLHRF
ncbi:MAG: porin [Proteobacteria bacterium]|nr:porin [Burkholderiales bacterium]